MIYCDKDTFTRLQAGESLTLRHRSKRFYRHGESYTLTIEGRTTKARVLVAKAQIKPGSKYVWLLTVVLDNLEPLRYPAARCAGGELMDDVRDYVSSPEMSFEGVPSVDAFTQRRFSRDARDRERRALEDMIAAMEQVRSALDDRVRDNPELRKEISAELWQIRGRLDAAKNKLRRRMAA